MLAQPLACACDPKTGSEPAHLAGQGPQLHEPCETQALRLREA